jgi:hypothetical protein
MPGVHRDLRSNEERRESTSVLQYIKGYAALIVQKQILSRGGCLLEYLISASKRVIRSSWWWWWFCWSLWSRCWWWWQLKAPQEEKMMKFAVLLTSLAYRTRLPNYKDFVRRAMQRAPANSSRISSPRKESRVIWIIIHSTRSTTRLKWEKSAEKLDDGRR